MCYFNMYWWSCSLVTRMIMKVWMYSIASYNSVMNNQCKSGCSFYEQCFYLPDISMKNMQTVSTSQVNCDQETHEWLPYLPLPLPTSHIVCQSAVHCNSFHLAIHGEIFHSVCHTNWYIPILKQMHCCSQQLELFPSYVINFK